MSLTNIEWKEARENPELCESIGHHFRLLRGSVSQDAIATMAGVGIESIRRIEQFNARMISLDRLDLCAKAVGIGAAELVAKARAEPIVRNRTTGNATTLMYDSPIGRDTDRDQVIADLRERRGVLLFGAPGQGKTTLARYVASSVCGEYRHGTRIVDLESERQIENLPRLIAAALGMGDLPSNYEVLHDKAILLVLDSVDTMLRNASRERLGQELTAILRAMPNNARLILTSQTKLEKQGLVTREVRPLRDDAAVELFHRMSDGQYRLESVIKVGEFVRSLLGNHPLSIRIVARYGRSVALPFDDLWRLWDEKWAAIAGRDQGSLDDRSLQASFELSFESLPAPAQANFLILGLLPDGMPPALIREAFADRDVEVYEALHILRDRSLLEDQDNETGCPNRLRGPLFLFACTKLADCLRGSHPLGEQILAARASIDAWFDRYIAVNAPQFVDTDLGSKNLLIREQFHNIHASLDRRLAPSTDEATLAAAQGVLALYWAYHNNLSGAHNPISSTEDAISYLEKAQAIFFGNERSADANRCTYYIGNIHWLRGEIAKARSYLHEADGSDDVSEEIACEIQRAFAHIEYKEGDILSAIERYKATAERAGERFLGCTFRCWTGLLDAYRKLEWFDEAKALMGKIERRMDDCPVQVVGNIWRGHAYVLASSGCTGEAEQVYRHALDVFRDNAFGQAHCWRGLGDLFVRREAFDEAAEAFDRAMVLYDEARKNPSLGVALVGLGRGRLALARGETDGALAELEATAQLLDREHLNEPYEFAVAHELIGELLARTGHPDRARAEFSIAHKYFGKVGAAKIAERIRTRMN